MFFAALLALKVRGARADDGGAGPSLATADVTLTLSRFDDAMQPKVLDAAGLATLLNVTRCACPTNVLATVILTSAAAATLGVATVDVTLALGSDCDTVGATACKPIGSTMTLTAQSGTARQTLSTGDLFSASVGQTSCASLPTTSTRLWAILRVAGARSGAVPSLALDIGARPPAAPSAITATSADGALLVKWKGEGDAAKLSGFQVLCLPGVATPPAPAFAACPEVNAAGAQASAAADAGADGATGPAPFATVDDTAVCSSLVAAGRSSVRVAGLENGRAYQVAVLAVGSDGTPSAPSAAAQGTPGPTVGFEDLYRDSGGAALGGCALAPAIGDRCATPLSVALAAVVAGLALRRRPRPSPRVRRLGWRWRRKRGQRAPWRSGRCAAAAIVFAGALLATAGRARAGVFDLDDTVARAPPPLRSASPRRWNLELRFGPYRPDVDAEFAGRNLTTPPYATTFGSQRRLMSQLELDRHLSHAGGTWALGLGIGYFRATADSLTPDLKTRAGDQTALRLIPLAASLVYRADSLLEKANIPFVPYAKAGFDCALWSISETSKTASLSGRSWGWHASAGVAMALDFIDPEAIRAMDQETGVNHASVFLEVTHAAIDGLGAANQLHVGDTTWLGGLMVEL
ncbi:MAG TPA: MXAN_2562 family outer membrane beta-barrel protein [Polyangia bacterium]|nr:MXAN_2562 family outer membrane beta-barrel protein [Polyangia bacterium]